LEQFSGWKKRMITLRVVSVEEREEVRAFIVALSESCEGRVVGGGAFWEKRRADRCSFARRFRRLRREELCVQLNRRSVRGPGPYGRGGFLSLGGAVPVFGVGRVRVPSGS